MGQLGQLGDLIQVQLDAEDCDKCKCVKTGAEYSVYECDRFCSCDPESMDPFPCESPGSIHNAQIIAEGVVRLI